MRRKILQRDVEVIKLQSYLLQLSFLLFVNPFLHKSRQLIGLELSWVPYGTLEPTWLYLSWKLDWQSSKLPLVVVTEVLGGGKFYVQTVGDQKMVAVQQQLASLSLQEAPVIGAINPAKGDIVLAHFSVDNSWNRAMIVNGPRGAVESPKDNFDVFYNDYGNQEVIPYSRLRPLDHSVPPASGLAQLCRLAFIKVPELEDDYGQEAAEYLSDCTLNSSKEFRAMIEEQDISSGKAKGQGTGTVLVVTLVDVEAESSINAAMLQTRKKEEVGHKGEKISSG